VAFIASPRPGVGLREPPFGDLYAATADSAWRVTDDGFFDSAPAWEPACRALTFASRRPSDGADFALSNPSRLYRASRSGDGWTVEPARSEGADEQELDHPTPSPDGRRLAFTEVGRNTIVVEDAAGAVLLRHRLRFPSALLWVQGTPYLAVEHKLPDMVAENALVLLDTVSTDEHVELHRGRCNLGDAARPGHVAYACYDRDSARSSIYTVDVRGAEPIPVDSVAVDFLVVYDPQITPEGAVYFIGYDPDRVRYDVYRRDADGALAPVTHDGAPKEDLRLCLAPADGVNSREA
jgi:hypothetical protein